MSKYRLFFRRRTAALCLPLGLLLGSTLASGCQKVCNDDGFAWQQDPSCLAGLTATETASETDTDDPSATDSATDSPTSSGGGGQWCVDADGDMYGDPDQCTDVPPGGTPPDGTVNNDDDCDDGSDTTYPGAAPLDSPTACMADVDGDDYGDVDPRPGRAAAAVRCRAATATTPAPTPSPAPRPRTTLTPA
ncbi:hypothetical protein [Nannocystis sp.]|uniref:hypothetical protein n=1 Tax=Nannocystis sp. TaxID=1962667 RepID=UPI0025EB574F|nr:hypothetical protein [Nannocystis sp.]MBK7827791.1 hypothetical protein [Nannocystis sp.]